MALRYLDLPEPKYVPTYNTLNQNLLAQSDAAVQQQGALAQQYRRDELDLAAEATINSFDNLGAEDQQFARERFERTRKRLGEVAQKEGARSLMPYVDQEVTSLQNDLRYHQKASQTKKAAKAALAENDQLPTTIKQQLLNKEVAVDYDPDTGQAIGVKGSYDQRDLNIAANWKDWTEDVQEFVKNMSPDVEESAQFYTDPQQRAMFRKRFKELGIDQVSAGAIDFLMSHPKYREQLELMGRLEIQNTQNALKKMNAERKKNGEEPIENPIAINENGEVIAKVNAYLTDSEGNYIKDGTDEFGNTKYKKGTKTKTFSSIAEYQAAKVGGAYSNQAFSELTYEDTRAFDENGKSTDNDLINRFKGLTGYNVPETEPSEYVMGVRKQVESMNKRFNYLRSSAQEDVVEILDDPDARVTLDEQGNMSVIYGEGKADDLDSMFKNGVIGQQQYDTLKDYESTAQASKDRAKALESELDNYRDAVVNQMADKYPELSSFFRAMGLDENGEFRVDEERTKDFSVDLAKFTQDTPAYSYDNAFTKSKLNRMKAGTTSLMNLKGVKSRGQGLVESTERPVLVSKSEDGELSFFEVNSVFREDYDDIKQKVTNVITGAGRKEVASLLLDEEKEVDNRLFQILERNPTLISDAGQGQITNSDGDPVQIDYDAGTSFKPSQILLGEDGQPVIRGALYDDNESVTDVVNWTGEAASSVVQQALGDGWNRILAKRSMYDMLPRLYSGETETVLSPQDLRNVAARTADGKTFDEVRIKTKKKVVNGQPTTKMYVTIPELQEQPFVVKTSSELQELLARKTIEALESGS